MVYSRHTTQSGVLQLSYTINLIMYLYTVSHNTTILSMSDKQLHWVQLHVLSLGIGHHQVVLRLIEQLYNKQGILGGIGGGGGDKISSLS